MMAKLDKDTKKGMGLHARRVLAYIVLIIISFFCLFWFYVMFINATRSKGELKAGFTAVPSHFLLTNWNNLVHGTLPIWSGMINSLIISGCAAVLCTYFSTMTAYAIHAYEFKLKKYIYPFILMIMMIPTQVTALGFIKLVNGMNLMDSFIPLIVPSIASPVVLWTASRPHLSLLSFIETNLVGVPFVPKQQYKSINRSVHCEGVKGATAKPPCRLRRGDSPCHNQNKFP